MLTKTDIGELEFQIGYYTNHTAKVICKTEYTMDLLLIRDDMISGQSSLNYVVQLSTLNPQHIRIKHITEINGMFNDELGDNIKNGINKFHMMKGW